MPEPTDMVVPMLQRIHADVAETKRELGRKIDANSEHLAHHGEKLEAIEGYLMHNLGITSKHAADIETLREEVRTIKKRLEALETR